MLVSLVIGLTACEKKYETENLTTRTTYYAVFDMVGETFYTIPLGGDYADEGCTATEDGAPLTVDVSTAGTYTGYSGTDIDVNVADQYVTSYAAENSDGYSIAAEREIWVAEAGDFVDNIAGLYTSTIYRDDALAFEGVQFILIWKTGENTYEISDAAGGYYYLGRAYGYGYAAQGAVITVNDIPSNDYSITDGVFPIWGNVITIADFTVNADSKTITFNGNADFGSVFTVTLTQVQL